MLAPLRGSQKVGNSYNDLPLGILAHLLRIVMEDTFKYYAFRRWLDTLIIIWQGGWIPKVAMPLLKTSIQESYVPHPDIAHSRQSPVCQLWNTIKWFPLQPVGRGLGMCSKGVLKQPWITASLLLKDRLNPLQKARRKSSKYNRFQG